MINGTLTPDLETGHWRDESGQEFILNRFNDSEEIAVHLGVPVWSATYFGVLHRLDWSVYSLPKTIIDPLRDVLRVRLFDQAPGLISTVRNLLNNLEEIHASKRPLPEDLFFNINALSEIWTDLPDTLRVILRAFYGSLVEARDPRADGNIHSRMKSWKARSDILNLRAVLEWDPERGALTTAELEVLRQAIPTSIRGQSHKTIVATILLRSFLATLRRSQQINRIRRDGLEVVQPTPNDVKQYFLVIPKIKAQTNEPPDWEAIPSALGEMIEAYSALPDVAALQQETGFLLVVPPKVGKPLKEGVHFALSSQTSRNLIIDWVDGQRLISPRTKQIMHVTMQRIRHTGATQLARQGYPRQVIQDMLQQDSPASASAYIDCVASDLAPVFERADRQTGFVFSQLRDAFFKGRIVPTPDKPKAPILVPKHNSPAIVGSCNKQGVCGLHPLFSCYSGCPYFLAFREANHKDVLTHVMEEYTHWRAAEPNGERSKVIKDFERTMQGVRDVIAKIDTETHE